ncbi:hypothetical protein ACWEPI_08470 [Streptomyces sp. NPDC004262]
MNAPTNAATAGDARGVPGRPARTDRPVRFQDPEMNARYWARIEHIVSAAPPLSNEQRAVIRAAFHQPMAKEAA